MKTVENESLHKRLERLRQQKGLTAKAMAKLIGVPASTYRDWEKGKGLKLPPYQKISQVLAVPVTELVTGEKPTFNELYEKLESIESDLHQLRLKIGLFL